MAVTPCPWCAGPLEPHCASKTCGWCRCAPCKAVIDFSHRIAVANDVYLAWPPTPEDTP